MAENWLDLFPAESLKEGERQVVEFDEFRILITRQNGELYAVESMCSHAMFELDEGEIEENCIICPLHGAAFCLKTGEALSPPAYEPIRIFPLRVNSGILQIDIN